MRGMRRPPGTRSLEVGCAHAAIFSLVWAQRRGLHVAIVVG
jgi:hypothetical protein